MKYGYPLIEREQAIRELADKRKVSTFPLIVFNEVHQLPVIEVPIELLKYRLQNGRTASLQLEDIAKSSLSADYYRSDFESTDSQSRQHQLLKILVDSDQNFQKAFEKEKLKQLDPLIIDPRGFVVNGNRRLCCWRELLESAPAEYGHFQIIRVAVLPASITEAEIRKIESRLQLQPDLRDDYTWHAQANMYRNLMRELNLDSKGVAENFSLTQRDVDTSLRMLQLGEQYLGSRGVSQQWSLLDKKEFGFRRLVLEEKEVPTLLDKEILQNSAFLIIDGSDEFGDRAWALIPKIRSSIKDWKETVSETYKPKSNVQIKGAAANVFVKGAKPLTEMDAGVATFLRSADAKQRSNLKEKLAEFLEDVTDKEQQVSRNARLLKGLRLGLGNLKSATEYGLVPEAQTDGVDDIIKEITDHLNQISVWLKAHKK